MPKMPKSARPEGDGKASEAKADKPQPRTNGKRRRNRRNGGGTAVAERDFDRRRVDDPAANGGTGAPAAAGETVEQPAVKKSDLELNDFERDLLSDLMAVIGEHEGESAEPIARAKVERSFVFACERHADQRRQSGEDFIVHPVGVAKICAGMRLDTATL